MLERGGGVGWEGHAREGRGRWGGRDMLERGGGGTY